MWRYQVVIAYPYVSCRCSKVVLGRLDESLRAKNAQTVDLPSRSRATALCFSSRCSTDAVSLVLVDQAQSSLPTNVLRCPKAYNIAFLSHAIRQVAIIVQPCQLSTKPSSSICRRNVVRMNSNVDSRSSADPKQCRQFADKAIDKNLEWSIVLVVSGSGTDGLSSLHRHGRSRQSLQAKVTALGCIVCKAMCTQSFVPLYGFDLAALLCKCVTHTAEKDVTCAAF